MMTPKQRFMKALNLEEPDQVPFADWVDPGIRQKLVQAMGKESMDDAQFAQGIGFDAIGFQDLYNMSPVCDETKMDDQGRLHYMGRGKIRTQKDLSMMIFPDIVKDGILDKAKRFIDDFGKKDLALYCGIRPGIQPTYLSLGWMGFAESLLGDKKLITGIYDRYIEWNCRNMDLLEAAGFDFFFLYDDIAYRNGTMFSPDAYREVFLPRFKLLSDAITIPWAYHSDGDLTKIFDDLLSLGMNAINPIEPPTMDIEKIKEEYGGKVALWGNIDLIHTLPYGTIEEVEAEVKERINKIGKGGGFILGTANSITDFCKVENVMAMSHAVKKYGQYPI
ncbi:uroporphyrinogen decarboxylase family protein [Desulfobacula sp.]